MEIIGLTGQARCGKSHAAEYLCKLAFEAGATPHRVSFAGALKRASAEAGFPKETHPKEYREFCQTEGAARRAEDPDHWVKLTLQEIKEIRDKEDKKLEEGHKFWEQVVIIDDVRYQNEIDAILRMGGTMAHICAGDRLPTPHARWRRHESEKMAKAIDRTKGKGKRFEAFFQTVMPWGKRNEELDVFWLDNSGTPEDLEVLLGVSFGLMTNREQLTPAAREIADINNISEEEKEQLMDFINQLIEDLDIEEGGDLDGYIMEDSTAADDVEPGPGSILEEFLDEDEDEEDVNETD